MENGSSNKFASDKKNERAGTAAPFFFYFFLFAGLVVLDQYAKHLAFAGSLGWLAELPLTFVRVFLFQNYNFAFSLPLPVWLMYAIYAAVLGAIARYIYGNWSSLEWPQKMAWVLIVAGAVSNIGERIAFGYVRDFIYILSGIFNPADGYILAGVVVLLIWDLRGVIFPGPAGTKF